MVVITLEQKSNRAKKSTGKVFDSPQDHNLSHMGLLEGQSMTEHIFENIPRPTFKSTNLEPFIIVCQDEKLTKSQLDHLSKQWEIYEAFIKELELLSKHIRNTGPYIKKEDKYNDTYEDVELDDAGLPLKRIRKPKAIYSPTHKPSSTYSTDDNSSNQDVADSIPLKKKKGFVPRIKLGSASSTPLSSLKPKPHHGYIKKAKENEISAHFYGKRVDENIQSNQNNINNKLLLPFKCTKCDLTFTDNIPAMVHVMIHLKPQFAAMCKQENRCKYCYRKFANSEDRDIHQVKVHLNDLDHHNVCLFCETHYPNVHELKAHMYKSGPNPQQQSEQTCFHKTKEMPFWCQLCETQSSSYTDVLVHFKEEHKGTIFALCPFCLVIIKIPRLPNSTFLPLDVYFNHMTRHVTPTPENMSIENVLIFNEGKDKLRQIQCQLCRLNFCHIEQYEKHRSKHHEAYGGNSLAKSTIRVIQLPRKLGDFWSVYTDWDTFVKIEQDTAPELTGKKEQEINSQRVEGSVNEEKAVEPYATSKVIRKPKIDLKPYLPAPNDSITEDNASVKKSGALMSVAVKQIPSSVFSKKAASTYASNLGLAKVKAYTTTNQATSVLQPTFQHGTKFWVRPDVLLNQTCWECRKDIKTADHYRRRKRCKLCNYSTCCYRALDWHQKDPKSHGYVAPPQGVRIDDIFILTRIQVLCVTCTQSFTSEIEWENHFKNHPECSAGNSFKITRIDAQNGNKTTLALENTTESLAIKDLYDILANDVQAFMENATGVTTNNIINNEDESLDQAVRQPNLLKSALKGRPRNNNNNSNLTPQSILKKPNPEQPLLTSSKKLKVEFNMETKVRTIEPVVTSPVKHPEPVIMETEEFDNDEKGKSPAVEPLIRPCTVALLMNDVLTNTTSTLSTENV